MWFARLSLFKIALVSASIGFTVNVLFNSPLAVVEVPHKDPCQDKVMPFDDVKSCPPNMYLEFFNGSNAGMFVICHCSRPIIMPAPERDDPQPFVPRDVLPPFNPDLNSPKKSTVL